MPCDRAARAGRSAGYAGFGEWEILEGRYTLAIIFEYAATLGLVDVAYDGPAGARDDYHGNWGAEDVDYLSRYDGLRAVRLNGLGAYALGLTDTYETPPRLVRSRSCPTSTWSRPARSARPTVWSWRATPSAPPTGSGHSARSRCSLLSLPAVPPTIFANSCSSARRSRSCQRCC